MIVDHSVGYLIGYAVGFAILAVIAAFSRDMWVQRAHKLAAQSNIALPGQLAGRVARFLRDEFLFGQLIMVAVIPLTDAVIVGNGEQRHWAAWFPWILAGLPLFWIIYTFVASAWPRWKASGENRVTHLTHVSVRQAFTEAELTAVVIGAVSTAALGVWGLWRAAAPAMWWLACAAALAAAVAAWHYAARSIMNRPSSASDEIELGWDDLLRFRRVRGVTAGAAWGSALFVYLIDCVMSSAFVTETVTPGMVSYQLQWWPVVVPVVAGFLLYWVFRQGRQLWRRAWLERGGFR